jgi:hypothetical protein
VLAKADGSKTVFKQSEQGLFYVDTADEGTVFINTVVDNQTKYSSRERTRADAARRLQQIIGLPSTRDFINIVNKNLLPNCTVIAADIKAAEHIYGPDVGILMGKTVRRKADEVLAPVTDVPSSILERYRDVTVSADIMKVNGVSFFMSISRHIKFGTAEMIDSHHAKVLLKAVTDLRNHCKLQFGEYVQVHEEHSNNMAPRTTGALALRPTGNDQGGHYFYSLATGKRVNRNHWTKLPMPAEAIDRVHQLARRDKVTGGLVVEGRNVVEDDDDDSDFDPNDSDDDQSVNSDDESYADNVREVDADPVQYQHTGHVAGVYPHKTRNRNSKMRNPILVTTNLTTIPMTIPMTIPAKTQMVVPTKPVQTKECTTTKRTESVQSKE